MADNQEKQEDSKWYTVARTESYNNFFRSLLDVEQLPSANEIREKKRLHINDLQFNDCCACWHPYFLACSVYQRCQTRLKHFRTTKAQKVIPRPIFPGSFGWHALAFLLLFPFYGFLIAHLQRSTRKIFGIKGSHLRDMVDGYFHPLATLGRIEVEFVAREDWLCDFRVECDDPLCMYYCEECFGPRPDTGIPYKVEHQMDYDRIHQVRKTHTHKKKANSSNSSPDSPPSDGKGAALSKASAGHPEVADSKGREKAPGSRTLLPQSESTTPLAAAPAKLKPEPAAEPGAKAPSSTPHHHSFLQGWASGANMQRPQHSKSGLRNRLSSSDDSPMPPAFAPGSDTEKSALSTIPEINVTMQSPPGIERLGSRRRRSSASQKSHELKLLKAHVLGDHPSMPMDKGKRLAHLLDQDLSVTSKRVTGHHLHEDVADASRGTGQPDSAHALEADPSILAPKRHTSHQLYQDPAAAGKSTGRSRSGTKSARSHVLEADTLPAPRQHTDHPQHDVATTLETSQNRSQARPTATHTLEEDDAVVVKKPKTHVLHDDAAATSAEPDQNSSQKGASTHALQQDAMAPTTQPDNHRIHDDALVTMRHDVVQKQDATTASKQTETHLLRNDEPILMKDDVDQEGQMPKQKRVSVHNLQDDPVLDTLVATLEEADRVSDEPRQRRVSVHTLEDDAVAQIEPPPQRFERRKQSHAQEGRK